jgi:hypothetical protein
MCVGALCVYLALMTLWMAFKREKRVMNGHDRQKPAGIDVLADLAAMILEGHGSPELLPQKGCFDRGFQDAVVGKSRPSWLVGTVVCEMVGVKRRSQAPAQLKWLITAMPGPGCVLLQYLHCGSGGELCPTNIL